ncbi:LacI family transcriptional regulator [Rhodovibrio sodomensis]|uniref:LacI family transcriptional regulator n=1 Tax=Rhodovibrio sodomensis TaxID=1088 RepID=A0ABS1DL87_9PROT|nr:sugar ABC transporter substrate-binding protein [Rhodovibrio sodomensis]MBK1670766.1 LacI family transcriptional regulator [Rhodovibrio sodomensis]
MKVCSRALTAAGLAIALCATPAAAQEDLEFVVVTHGQAADPFWSVAKNGVDEAAEDMGVDVTYRAPTTYDMVKMGQLIDAAVASDPDGLVVTIPDADALRGPIKNAIASDIPVISVNSGAEPSKELGTLIHVGQTPYEAGLGAGERMAEAGVDNAVCINQEVGNVALDKRCEGFADGLGEDAKTQVLAVSIDPTEVRNSVVAFLRQNPDVNGILTLGPTGADPTLQALKRLGKVDDYKFGTFDLSPATLRAVEKGNIMFAIDQQQYLQGYLPIVLLTQYNKYGVLPAGDVLLTGPGFVTEETAGNVIDLAEEGYR